MSPLLPVAFVNGWILGAYLWALVWFEASPRAVVERLSRLILSSLVILLMMREATQFFMLEIPGVSILAVVLAPYAMMTARWNFAISRTSLNAPDISNRRTRPLSFLDFGTAMILVALLCAWIRTQDSAIIFQLLAYIGFVMVPTLIVTLMITGLAKTDRWLVQVLIVFLALIVVGLVAWGASTWFEYGIRELSWADIIEISPLADASIEAIRLRELCTVLVFSVSVMLPSLLTLGLLYHQGYRLCTKAVFFEKQARDERCIV